MKYDELLLLPENFIWAWRKAKRLYNATDIVFNQAEVAAFELDLEQNLRSIRDDFIRGKYQLQTIKLLPQPKKPKDGSPRMRQSFEISVRDQVAWIALVNVIGPILDMRMPAWSYGHRLYRTTWFENTEDDKSILNIGPYRHSTGQLSRKFNQSWPLYRRQIAFTAKKMVGVDITDAEMTMGDRQAYARGQKELEYLNDGYWTLSRRTKTDLYFASLDLAKFYPSVRARHITAAIEAFLPEYAESKLIPPLLTDMLLFKATDKGLSVSTLQATEPPLPTSEYFDRIPTGLWAAGFLSNIALLPLDKKVEEIIRSRRTFAQFRFVDDHSFLAYDFDGLLDWMREYENLLHKNLDGVEIAEDKYLPKDLNILFDKVKVEDEKKSSIRSAVEAESRIDGARPTKLMTHTLAQVSIVANTDFDVIGDQARAQRLEQLEWLLQANIPDTEIRADTRVAFAAGQLARLLPATFHPLIEKIQKIREQTALSKTLSMSGQMPAHLLGELQQHLTTLTGRITELENNEHQSWQGTIRRTFYLLFAAFEAFPDKPRLFSTLFAYCIATGYSGLLEISMWLQSSEPSIEPLKRYLRAFALQTVGRQLPHAAHKVTSKEILHRESRAAHSYLLSVTNIDWTLISKPHGLFTEAPDYFERNSASSFVAGVLS